VESAAGIVLVAAAVVAAARLAPAVARPGAGRILTGSLAFAAVFLGAFHVLGIVELLRGRPSIDVTAAAAVAVAAGAVVLATVRRAAPRPAPADSGWRPVPLAAAAAMTALFAAFAVLLMWGTPRGFEVNAYHLPVAVRALRDGTLAIWDQTFMFAYPANMGLWAGFFLHLLPEGVAAAANLPLLGLICVAVYALGRAAGADRPAALLIAAGLPTVPMYGFSALEVGADLGGIAFALVAVVAVATRLGGPALWPLLAGLAAGLAFGFKSLNLVMVAAIGLVILADAAAPPARPLRARLRPPVVYGLAALGAMGFWLARNYVALGNPLYPLHIPGVFDLLGWAAPPDVSLFGREGTETEWVRAKAEWLVYPWVEWHQFGQNFKNGSGLGAFFAATVPVAWVLALAAGIGAVVRARGLPAPSDASRTRAILFFLGSAVVAGWWILGDRKPRYAMGAVALLLPLAAWLLAAPAGRLRAAYEALIAFCIAAMALVPLVQFGARTAATMAHDFRAPRHMLREYPAAIDRLPPGAVVMTGTHSPDNYTVFGAGLRNGMVTISEAARRFARPDGSWYIDDAGLRASGATHFYTEASKPVAHDPCVTVRAVDRLEANPFNGAPYDSARVLYALSPCPR